MTESTVCRSEKNRQLFFKHVDNCYWNPKLVITELPSGDRTVIATDPIEADELLVVLNQNSFSKENISQLESGLTLPAYLYQFYVDYGVHCPHGYEHYFHSLPTYEWYAENHALLKLYLSLSEVQRKKLATQFFLIGRINVMLEWLDTIPDHEAQPKEAIRAVIACSTRAWSRAGLVPWIDFFNHAYDGSMLSNNGTSIKATHHYAKGAEVNTTYGLKDSLQLLTIYGYETKEKTLLVARPPISTLLVAANPDLEDYHAFSKEHPFLFRDELNGFEHFLSHFRLMVFDKNDLAITNRTVGIDTPFVNGDNEYKAVKSALMAVNETEKYFNKMFETFKEIVPDVPEHFWKEYEVKTKILLALREKIHQHWKNLVIEN